MADISKLQVPISGTNTEFNLKDASARSGLASKTNNTNIATVEASTTASKSYKVGDLLIYDGQLYKVTTAILARESIIISGASANVTPTTIDAYLTPKAMIKGVDYVTAGQKANTTLGSRATVEGQYNTASGDRSHAEGDNVTASNSEAHAEGSLSTASGEASHAEGKITTASGNYSHAEGNNTTASGIGSHAEGRGAVTAAGIGSHAGGSATRKGFIKTEDTSQSITAEGAFAHGRAYGNTSVSDSAGIKATAPGAVALGDAVEGFITASGAGALAEGTATSGTITAASDGSHTGGYADTYGEIKAEDTSASVKAEGAFAHGYAVGDSANEKGIIKAINEGSFAHGYAKGYNNSGSIIASGKGAFASGFSIDNNITASGDGAHAEGYVYDPDYYILASGKGAHAEGFAGSGGSVIASGDGSHAEGCENTASGDYSHVEGWGSVASGEGAHAEGDSVADGSYSHAEGSGTQANGDYSHAEGADTTASEPYSHAEGHDSNADGYASHAEGHGCNATGYASHAEGDGESNNLEASGDGAHAEGYSSEYAIEASGNGAHAEGLAKSQYITASGDGAHAEGDGTTASGDTSHAGGLCTIAQRRSQTAIGEYNIADTTGANGAVRGDYAFIIGNGTGNNARSNAFGVKWTGETVINGDVVIGQHYDSTQSADVDSNLTVSGIVTVNGSDYAEKFEEAEPCPVNRFVTLDGEKIRLAQPDDDYILGVTSEKPAIIGDKDNDGVAVGLIGKLWVVHDGTAKVNGYVVSGANGIATDKAFGYRVMAVDGNRCKILVK